MMMKTGSEKLGLFQIVILVLSFYVLGALVASTFFHLGTEVEKLLSTIDNFICIVFLIDFIQRFIKADNKWHFMKWGWIDLLSSIPALDYFRVGRLLRIIRLLRILRAFRSAKVLIGFIFKNRMKGTFTSVSLIAILMVIFSSVAILQVETTEGGNIKTAEDALWWSFVTITTVGYGDKFPVTSEGRIIAAALMIVGVGLFGVFTGFVASWFVEGKPENPE